MPPSGLRYKLIRKQCILIKNQIMILETCDPCHQYSHTFSRVRMNTCRGMWSTQRPDIVGWCFVARIKVFISSILLNLFSSLPLCVTDRKLNSPTSCHSSLSATASTLSMIWCSTCTATTCRNTSRSMCRRWVNGEMTFILWPCIKELR